MARTVVDWYIALGCVGLALLSVYWAAAASDVRRRLGLGMFRYRNLSPAERWRVAVPHWFVSKALFVLWFGGVIGARLLTGHTLGSDELMRWVLAAVVTYWLIAKAVALRTWLALPERDMAAHAEYGADVGRVRDAARITDD